MPGTVGQAAEFAATGDYLEIIDDGVLASPAGLTVMSWFSLRSLTDRTSLVTKPLQSSSNNSWSLVIESDGRPFFFSTDPGNVDNYLYGNDPVAQGVWTHFAITWDGQIKRLYIDGQLAAEQSAALAFDRSAIVVGGDIDSGRFGAALDGFLDEIRIYRRPLTASEIATAAGL